jgi:hypothetical protein
VLQRAFWLPIKQISRFAIIETKIIKQSMHRTSEWRQSPEHAEYASRDPEQFGVAIGKTRYFFDQTRRRERMTIAEIKNLSGGTRMS